MEVDHEYWKRVWFIVKNTTPSDEITSDVIAYSNIWSAITFRRCKYSETVMQTVADMEKNMYELNVC